MDLYAYIFIGLFVGFVALSLKFAFERDEPPHLPDCYGGIFTPEQATRFIAMKQQYAETEEVQR